MKNLIKLIASGVAIYVGMGTGQWLYENVIEDKLDDLKDRLSKKKEREA